jgi:hypothetical protein
MTTVNVWIVYSSVSRITTRKKVALSTLRTYPGVLYARRFAKPKDSWSGLAETLTNYHIFY